MQTAPRAAGIGSQHGNASQQLRAGWEPMSDHYLEGRAELLDSIVDHLTQRLANQSSVVVELGSGTGTLLARLAASLPSARLVGVEIDPVLRRLHQLGPASAHGARVHVVDADLGGSDWTRSIEGPVDVVSAEYHPDHRSLREPFAVAGMAPVVVEQRLRSSKLIIVGV